MKTTRRQKEGGKEKAHKENQAAKVTRSGKERGEISWIGCND